MGENIKITRISACSFLRPLFLFNFNAILYSRLWPEKIRLGLCLWSKSEDHLNQIYKICWHETNSKRVKKAFIGELTTSM